MDLLIIVFIDVLIMIVLFIVSVIIFSLRMILKLIVYFNYCGILLLGFKYIIGLFL